MVFYKHWPRKWMRQRLCYCELCCFRCMWRVKESWSSLLVRNKSKYFRASGKQWGENKRLLAEETCPLSYMTSLIMSPPQEPPCCAMVLWRFPMTFNHRDNYLLLSADHDKSVSAVTGPHFSFLPYEQSIKIHTEVTLWNFSPESWAFLPVKG